MRTTKKKEETKEVKKSELQECVVLWLRESKAGKQYLAGHDFNNNNVLAYFNETTNEKQPFIRVFALDENNKKSDEIITLWRATSLKGENYLSGYTDEQEKVIGFYTNNKENEKLPYVRIYFKDENK